MDPDATLALIREITKYVNEPGPWDNGTEVVDTLGQLAELVDALDGWLSNGGFLPAPWHTELEEQ